MERKLYRSRKERVIAGVCGGLAQYFQLDPVLIRLIAIATIFMGGSGIILYIIAMFVIPEEPKFAQDSSDTTQTPPKANTSVDPELRNKAVIGIALFLIGVGTLFLLNQFEPFRAFFSISWKILFGILLISIGLVVVLKTSKGNKR